MSSCHYKQELLPLPQRLRSRPLERGYPVPWFVAKVGEHYDFRVIDSSKFKPAIKERLCWVCGQKLGSYLAFPIGPMCAINRTISEPPSHRECAEWSIKVCPFLVQRQEERRETHLPANVKEAAGNGIKRQPGAVCLWITKSYQPFNDGKGGLLFEVGDPVEVLWFREGREATREEVLESIDSGYPLLMEMAKQDGPNAINLLERMRDRALTLLPGGDR